MMETTPHAIEKNSEPIPKAQEIKIMLERLKLGKMTQPPRVKADKHGIYLFEVETPELHGTSEISYMRKGEYAEGFAAETAIYITHRDFNGVPLIGELVGKYINGEWNFVGKKPQYD